MLLVAPAVQHRIIFRRRDKRHLVRAANRYALAGLAALAIAMTSALSLVAGVVAGDGASLACATGAAIALGVFWVALPLHRRRVKE